jgi:factor associated with neutral sphingomyelinase activation
MEDINERILIETVAERITPLVNNPGKVVISNRIIYFQAFNNISINPVDKYHLRNIINVAKRRYILRPVGIEIFLENEETVFFAFKSPKLREDIHLLLLKQEGFCFFPPFVVFIIYYLCIFFFFF